MNTPEATGDTTVRDLHLDVGHARAIPPSMHSKRLIRNTLLHLLPNYIIMSFAYY